MTEMGIKNLHRLLGRYAAGCYRDVHLSHYATKKIAIDVSLYLYKYKAVQGPKWPESFLGLIVALRKWNVHCVFIFDGQAPIEKWEEQQRRRSTRARHDDRVHELEEEIRLYEKTGEAGERMREIQRKEGVVSLFRKRETLNLTLIRGVLEEWRARQISITPGDLDLARELFDALSVPHLTAPQEAEAYASQLCLNGRVDAVMSEDTDVLAYGTPLFLTKVDPLRETVVEISYEKVLEELEVSRETFTDLCIMLGCDYNSNLPMVGMEKSHSLMKEWGSCEQAIAELRRKAPERYDEETCGVLKWERCRELFSKGEARATIGYCGTPEWKTLADCLWRHSIRYDLARIRRFLAPIEVVLE